MNEDRENLTIQSIRAQTQALAKSLRRDLTNAQLDMALRKFYRPEETVYYVEELEYVKELADRLDKVRAECVDCKGAGLQADGLTACKDCLGGMLFLRA